MSTCDDRMEDGVEEDRMDVEPGQEEEHEENMESDDDMDDEDDEDDEDEHRLEPIMDGRNVRAQQRCEHTATQAHHGMRMSTVDWRCASECCHRSRSARAYYGSFSSARCARDSSESHTP